MIVPDTEIGHDRSVDPRPGSIFPEGSKVFLYVDPAEPVESDNVKITDGLIVLGRIARCHDDEPVRDPVRAKGLVLQELQHRGRQRLGDTVDLIQKQDPLLHSGGFDLVIDCRNDLAHCVLCHGVLPAAIVFPGNKRKADGALSGVVGDGIRDQADTALLGDLFHDRRLADPGRPHQKNRALLFRWDRICSCLVLVQISLYGVDDHFFCFFYIHMCDSSCLISLAAAVRNC